MRSYSPYDNVRAQVYPPILVTAGLNDPRVGYWEPAKWTAKLRATKTDRGPLLREEALIFAFIASTVGRGAEPPASRP